MIEARPDPLEPVILLGMHRSGTGLVARMLDRLGVFMGASVDPNGEAWFFLDLNKVALYECGVRWDHPEGVEPLLESPQASRLIQSYFEYMLESPASRRFTGSPWYRRNRGVRQAPAPWGWKDPRTVLLLPIWLRVFPAARLIFVTRHGVDVAASLRARQRAALEKSLDLVDRNELLNWRHPDRPMMDSVRAGTLPGAFGIWEYYMGTARRSLASRPHLEVRFEELVRSPTGAVREIAHFLGIEASAAAAQAAAAMPRSSRAYAFHDNPELRAFAEQVSERLAAFGYTPADEPL